jgi:hypothetical protein
MRCSAILLTETTSPPSWGGKALVRFQDSDHCLGHKFTHGLTAGVDSSAATVFVTTHDSERGNTGGSLNYKSPNNAYTLANVFMLAYPYGTPTILSSYRFDNGDAGAPNGGEYS